MLTKINPDSIKRKWLDVPYAAISSSQKLDIYLPDEDRGPFPAVIQIHGGAFKMGDKASEQIASILAATARGYAVVAINYRLSSDAKFPVQINDVKAAIRFVRAKASEYNINPDKLAAWGASAGGSLAALAGTASGVRELEDNSLGNAEQSDRIQAVVDWFGPIYFSTMDAEFAALGITPVGVTSAPNSPESAYLGKIVGSAEAEILVKQASAQTYISEDAPPFLIQHGTLDRNIPITQSINFSEKLKSLIGDKKVIFEAIDGAGHGGPQFVTAANLKKVLNFLDTYLK